MSVCKVKRRSPASKQQLNTSSLLPSFMALQSVSPQPSQRVDLIGSDCGGSHPLGLLCRIIVLNTIFQATVGQAVPDVEVVLVLQFMSGTA